MPTRKDEVDVLNVNSEVNLIAPQLTDTFPALRNGNWIRLSLESLRAIFGAGIGGAVNYTPAATGNPNNHNSFVTGDDGKLYFIDVEGKAIAFEGGDASGVDLKIYDAGNGCMVMATGEGCTFSKANGTGTLNIPAGVIVLGVTVQVAAGEAAYQAGNYNDAFRLLLQNNDANPNYNLGFATILLRNGFVIDASNQNNINDTTPLVFDPGLVEKSIPLLNGGSIALAFNNLGNSYTAGAVVGF